jgi:hypothetical protein
MFDGHNGNEAGFSPSTSGLPCQSSFQQQQQQKKGSIT